MKIRVNCASPKYVKGDYEFAKFEELFYWLTGIKSLSKGVIGAILFGIVKRGYHKRATARHFIDIECDLKDYFLAQDLGYKVGLLKTRNLGQHISKDSSVALQFARELDNCLT